MSKSYDRNIERLKANQSKVSAQEQGITTQAAKDRGDWQIREARGIATKLTPFSKALQDWKDKDIEKQLEIGRAERDKAKLENAKWMEENGTETQNRIIAIEKARAQGELADGIETIAAQDDIYLELKANMLKRDGTSAYPDADRLAKLSPWAQVGFVQESIKNKKAALADMVAHSMANSTEELKLGNLTYTPAEIKENNLAFPMKQHALEIMTDKVYRNLGLHKYSDAMLERAKVPQAVRATKESILAKYRERYNVESSMNTRGQADVAWNQSEKTAKDLQKYINTVGNTIGPDGKLLLNSGAWKHVEAKIVSEGVQTGNADIAEKYLDVPMPDSMCQKLGVPYGTKFSKQWKNKIPQLRKQIRKAISDSIYEEEKILKSENVALGNSFDELKRKGPIDQDTLNKFIRESSNRGGILDNRIKQYQTVSMHDKAEDTIRLDALVASNNGYITHEMLNEFHPEAAMKYREAATRHEAALQKKFNVDGQIKGALNGSWHDAGIKAKEKSVEWEFALANAREDYERKFNKLVAMGFDADNASRLALKAPLGSVTTPDGKPIPDFEGVAAEIQRMGALSQYTQESERATASIKESKIRVSKIAEGKVEMQKIANTLSKDNLRPFEKEVIGGKYGQDRIQEIIENIKIYGTWNGIRKSENALNYYEGLALGKRRLTGYGLIDAQLKAAGHPGLFPDRTEEKEDTTGQIDAATDAQAPLNQEGSAPSLNKVENNNENMQAFYSGESPVHNRTENLNPYLVA